MNTMLDGNTAALNRYEIEQAEADRVWAACQPEAARIVRDSYIGKKLTAEEMLDAIASAPDIQVTDLMAAINEPDFAEAGSILCAIGQWYLEYTVDDYMATDKAQEKIAAQVWIIHEENRG
jgi:hypothetical protein